jgi:DNA polymerase-3 subunit epsilon
MRQIVLDTETTGLEVGMGHRVIEIAAVEILNRRLTGRHFHRYLNPQRDIDAGALQVHGISLDFLQDKPCFPDVAAEFLEFIRGAELIIHNAEFDVGFLDYELGLLGAGYGRIRDHASVLDTLGLARERFPGQRNSLDALCRRLGVDNAHRKLHGALLDAELLADVYLAMTAGQGDLGLSLDDARPAFATDVLVPTTGLHRRVLRASAAELAAHEARLERIAKKSGGRLLWPAEAEDQEPALAS